MKEKLRSCPFCGEIPEVLKYEEKYYSSVSMLSFEFCGKKDSTNSYTDKEADYSGGDAVADDSDVPFWWFTQEYSYRLTC